MTGLISLMIRHFPIANPHHAGAFDGFNLLITTCIAEREFFVIGRLDEEEREEEQERHLAYQVCC